MKGHLRDLPTLRHRRASYNLLPLVRKAVRPIHLDTRRIREAERDQTGKTFRWRHGLNRAWRLTVR
jgi:hypothetical protein